MGAVIQENNSPCQMMSDEERPECFLKRKFASVITYLILTGKIQAMNSYCVPKCSMYFIVPESNSCRTGWVRV